MSPAGLLAIYCLLIMVASMTGGMLPSLVRLTHTRMQLLMSFVGGLMMGVAMLHLLPHAVVETQSLDDVAISAMAGLLVMFFLIRTFHVHQHTPADDHHDSSCDKHEHAHDPVGVFDSQTCHRHPLSWIGLAIGLSLHTMIDGIALAAGVSMEAIEGDTSLLAGLGVFLAVLLHKPLDALSITTVMSAGGWSTKRVWFVNLGFGLMCPLGALAFYFGVTELFHEQHAIVGCSLAFAAGVFLCISLADLLPEVQFHKHDRVKLSLALLFGVLVAYLIGFLEPAHTHQKQDSLQQVHEAHHDGHTH